jgi:type I restriction enzyme M protein
VGTAILIIENGKKAQSIWFYELSADGFSLTDTRTPIADNDIPDVLAKWQTREEGGKAFNVPVSELEVMEYELTPARYRKHEAEATHHDSPSQIIDEIIDVETEISRRLQSIRAKVSR